MLRGAAYRISALKLILDINRGSVIPTAISGDYYFSRRGIRSALLCQHLRDADLRHTDQVLYRRPRFRVRFFPVAFDGKRGYSRGALLESRLYWTSHFGWRVRLIAHAIILVISPKAISG